MKHYCRTAIVLFAPIASCASRIPSSPELDIRSGLQPSGSASSPPQTQTTLSGARFSSQPEKDPMMPVRVAPLVEKIWVYDQHLGPNAWLQGSWLFVEVEPAQWFDVVDPGSAPLVYSLPKEHLQTKTKKKKK